MLVLILFRGFSNLSSGAGISLSSLVVVEGKICWDLYIDGLVVSSDGNLLDALGAAIKVVSYRFLYLHIIFLYAIKLDRSKWNSLAID